MSIAQGVTLDIEQLRSAGIAITAIVKLATQPPNVYQQVTLRPDKISPRGFIRLGETPGDEALCWIRPEHILVCEILGHATQSADGKWTVTPHASAPGAEQRAA